MKYETYTKTEIDNAKKLMEILYPTDYENRQMIFNTKWGRKTNTGLLNTILAIMYPNRKGEILG